MRKESLFLRKKIFHAINLVLFGVVRIMQRAVSQVFFCLKTFMSRLPQNFSLYRSLILCNSVIGPHLKVRLESPSFTLFIHKRSGGRVQCEPFPSHSGFYYDRKSNLNGATRSNTPRAGNFSSERFFLKVNFSVVVMEFYFLVTFQLFLPLWFWYSRGSCELFNNSRQRPSLLSECELEMRLKFSSDTSDQKLSFSGLSTCAKECESLCAGVGDVNRERVKITSDEGESFDQRFGVIANVSTSWIIGFPTRALDSREASDGGSFS